MKGRTTTLVAATFLTVVIVMFTGFVWQIIVELWLAKGLYSQDRARVEEAALDLAVRGSARSFPRLWDALVRQLGTDPGAAAAPARRTGGPRAIDPVEPPSRTFRGWAPRAT